MTKSKLLQMNNVGIVVESLDAAISFFSELGLKLEGRATVEGEWAGRVTGLGAQCVEIAMMVTPDGHSRLELSRFITPPTVSDHRTAPVNALGYLRIMFTVEDIDEMVARLTRHGAQLVGEVVQYEDAYRLCYIRGTEGLLIGLAEELGNKGGQLIKNRMRKIIAAINMTLDGFCDHTAIIPDAEIHQHYAGLLKDAGAALYGRITYQLMEYWQPVVKNPTGNKATDEFAVAIDNIPKIVFSHTLKNVEWESARLANQEIEEEVLELKQQAGKDILVCSPGLIVALTKLNLIDEYQLCVHPVIAGGGLPLFKNINKKITLKLVKTKIFGSGAVMLYYEPKNKDNSTDE